MKKICINLILLLLNVIIVFAQTNSSIVPPPKYVQVKLKSNSPKPAGTYGLQTTNSQLNNIFSQFNVNKFKPILENSKRGKFTDYYIIEATGNADSLKSHLVGLNLFDEITVISPSQTTSCPNPVNVNDPELQWGGWLTLDAMEAKCAWSITKGSPDVKVAIVDADIDVNQPDLVGKIASYETQGVTNFNNRPIGWTAGSHGTRSLGVIAAQSDNNIGVASIGFNTKCSFYAADNTSYTPPNRGSGNTGPSILRAFDDGNKIISISYNGTGLSAQQAQTIVDNGTLLVVAAGNIAGVSYHQQLWNIPGVIIVSSVDEANNHGPTGNSRYAGVDLCAMLKIRTTDEPTSSLNPFGPYPAYWGTSSCAPQVAGTAALMLSVNPCLTPVEIELIIKSTTEPIADAASFPGMIGTGRLNAYKAVLKAQNWGNEHLIVNGGIRNITSLEYYKHITVTNNGVLNINNTTLYMAKDGRITIEPGSRVNIVNSLITAKEPSPSCEFPRYKWHGIVVEGRPTLNQVPIANQGYLYIQNSTIESCGNAISTYSLDLAGNINWAKTGGGIVKCNGATFRNNGRHVAFYQYIRPNGGNNASSFVDCTFEVDGAIDVSGGINRPVIMVTTWGVKGVAFNGCTFKNTNGSINADKAFYNRGVGIHSVESQLNIGAVTDRFGCVDIKRGSFFDLTQGFESFQSPSATLGHKLSKQDFTQNDRAINLSNGLATSVFKNNINLTVPNNYYNRNRSVNDINYKTGILGVYTNSATGYRIEQNTFTMTGGKVSGQVIVPIVMQNTDATGGGAFFRLNNINNTNIGTQTQTNNSNANIACNEYRGTGVSGHPNNSALQLNLLSTTGITPWFGECATGTNQIAIDKRKDFANTFITNARDGLNQPSTVKNYVVKLNRPNRPATGIRMNFDFCELRGLSVQNFDCRVIDEFKNPCERTYEPWPGGDPKLRYYLGKTDFQLINSQIQAGEASSLMQMVQQGAAIPAITVYNSLINNSPYLSNAIIEAMLVYSTHLTEQQLTNILIANAALADPIYQMVLNSPLFSASSIAQITSAQTSNDNALATAYSTRNYYYGEMVNARNDVILQYNLHALSDDSLNNWTDSIITFLSTQEDIESKKLLLATHYNVQHYTTAVNLLSQITNNGTQEDIDFLAYYNLMLQVATNGRNIYQLNDEELNTLTALTTHQTTAAEAAKGILTLLNGQLFDLFIERINGEQEGGYGKAQITSTPLIQQNDFINCTVYPNPTQASATIKYELKKYKRNIEIEVFDITGKKIYSSQTNALQGNITIDTQNWPNSIYIIIMQADGELILSTKLSVQH